MNRRSDACLETDTCPKIFEVNSENEYSSKGGSLLTTDTEGNDLEDSQNVRYYLMSSLPHGPGALAGICQQPQKPLTPSAVLRALVIDMDEWVTNGTKPPHNRVPTRADGTLVPSLPQSGMGFPIIPVGPTTGTGPNGTGTSVYYDGIMHTGDLFDFGPRFHEGIISVLPPVLLGTPYPIFVPKTVVRGPRVNPLFIFALLFTALFVLYAPPLRSPYFWDEAGYYVPAARDLLLTGSLIPHSTASNAHPPLALVLATIPVYRKLGSEFMPPLEEGALLYMPSTMPGISIGEAQKLLQVTDRIIKQFPEVDRVLGKAGRAETATDPASLSMLETVIILKPKSQWRKVDTWYSSWAPEWLRGVLRPITPDHISSEELVNEMNQALQMPGVANAWTMPIKGRIDMLSTGMRTPVGVKISGADLSTVEDIGVHVEAALASVMGTRGVFAERAGGGYFLDFDWDREELARYGLSVDEAQQAIQNAIGGENVTTTVEGPARYPVNVRYMRDFRSDPDALARVLVPASGGQRQIPIGKLAKIHTATGPSMIRNENGLLTGYVYVDITGRDPSGYVEDARRLLREKVKLPPGYAILWSGQFEAMQRVSERLQTVLPLTIVLILLLLYLNTRSAAKTLIVALAVPFSAVGAIWLLYWLGYNLSIGVWVGLVALLGVDAETGVFMLLYLDLAYEKARRHGCLGDVAGLRQAIVEGAARRIRPKFMTVATMSLGLIPIMWSSGTGSDVMKRIAAPMIGGIFTSFVLELVVYPAIYELWRWNLNRKAGLTSTQKQDVETPDLASIGD